MQLLIVAWVVAFNNPLLTANIITIHLVRLDKRSREHGSIIVGDGMFKFLNWLKLTDKFGQQVQYNLVDNLGNNLITEGRMAREETRRWEM